MTPETLKVLTSMARTFGPPYLGRCLMSADRKKVEYFAVNWPGCPESFFICTTATDLAGVMIPVVDFDEAVLKLTFGAFP